MTELIVLRKALGAVGNNLNQAVKKLNAYQDITQIKIWILLNEKTIQKIFDRTDEIKSKINQFSESWSQE